MTGFCVSGAARLDISFSLRKHYLVASWQLASEFPFLVVAGPQRQRSSSARDSTQHRGGHFYLWPQRPGVQLGGSFVQRVTGRAMALRAPTRIWKGPQNMHARALTRALSHTYRHMSAYLHNTQAPMYTLIHILTRPRPRHLLIFTNIHSRHTYTHTAHTYTHSLTDENFFLYSWTWCSKTKNLRKKAYRLLSLSCLAARGHVCLRSPQYHVPLWCCLPCCFRKMFFLIIVSSDNMCNCSEP